MFVYYLIPFIYQEYSSRKISQQGSNQKRIAALTEENKTLSLELEELGKKVHGADRAKDKVKRMENSMKASIALNSLNL